MKTVRKPLPPLESLRVLSVCVRHGNFSRAADELGITPTAVSQRVRALERQIGVRLFKRHGPRLAVTPRARVLGQRLEQALSLMREAVEECPRMATPLRLTCAPTFAARWLLPRLAQYHALPGADPIALDATQEVLPRGTFDVAIRSSEGPPPGYCAARLLTEQGTPMLSPARLPRSGRLTVKGLLQMPLIADARWPEWFRLAGVRDARPSFVATRFPNYELEAQAAARGIGAALLSPTLFAELLAQGALAAPFRQRVEGPNSYWLLWSRDAPEPHFVGWVRALMSPL